MPIETLMREAEEERALIAKSKQAPSSVERETDPAIVAEFKATEGFLEATLAAVTDKYKKASSSFRERLCPIREACVTTLRELRDVYAKEGK
jgi:hypothetical protein